MKFDIHAFFGYVGAMTLGGLIGALVATDVIMPAAHSAAYLKAKEEFAAEVREACQAWFVRDRDRASKDDRIMACRLPKFMRRESPQK